MARTNVYDYPIEGPATLAGHFDPAKATLIEEHREWSEEYGSLVSVVSGHRYAHEGLYRTAQDRWVLNRWSQWQGDAETYRFIDDDTAKDWLERNESYEELEKYFGAQDEEAGPAPVGRPEIGGRVTTALGERLLQDVDLYAASRKLSRAQSIRKLLAFAVDCAAVGDERIA